MRIKSLYSFINLIVWSMITLMISSCVPKALEKKANCGTNQKFNSVTRKCEATQVIRNKPIATLNSISVTEKTYTNYTLTYSDKENNKAISCVVTEVSSKIDAYTPKMSDAIVELKKVRDSLDVALQIHTAQVPSATHVATVTSNLADINSNISDIETSFGLSVIMPKFEDSITKAFASYDLMKNVNASASMTFYNTALRDQLNIAKPLLDSITNKCFCDGAGVCQTRIGVIPGSSGAAQFSYVVSDGIDGESFAENVNVSIINVNNKPLSGIGTYTIPESNTSTPSQSNLLSFPTGYDEDGDSLTPVIVTNPSKGTIACTSSGCRYTPTNGNEFSSVATAFAATSFYGIQFTASIPGDWANSLKFNFKSHLTTEDRLFKNSFYVEIDMPNINFFVPSNGSFFPNDLVNLINNHPYISLLGVALDTTGNTIQNYGALPQVFSMTGGAGGYDNFAYSYRDPSGDLSTPSKVYIEISATNDLPRAIDSVIIPTLTRNSTTSNPVAFTNVNLFNGASFYYTDVDAADNKASQCQVSFTNFSPGIAAILTSSTVPAQAELGTCTCDAIDGDANDGKCTFQIRPTYRMSSGTVQVYYSFRDSTDWATNTGSMIVQIDPSNVAPSFYVDGGTYVASTTTSINEDPAAFTEVVSVPIWANDGVSTDTEVIVGSKQQILQYSMQIDSISNPSLYTSLANNFIVKYETCNPTCTSQTVTASTSLTDFVTLGTGNGVTGIIKKLKLEFKPNVDQSGQFRVTFRLKDVPQNTPGETSLLSNDVTSVTGDYVSPTITVNPDNDAPRIYDTDIRQAIRDENPTTEIKIATVETAENSQVLTRTFIIDEGGASTHASEGGATEGDPNEDTDEIELVNFETDNPTLIPLNRIEPIFDKDGDGLYEDSATASVDEVFNANALPVELENFTTNDNLDSKLTTGLLVGKKLLFKITPTPGNYGVANIRFKLKDRPDSLVAKESTLKYVINVVVHPVSTIHGGWTHLAANGLKLKKDGSSLTTKFACSTDASKTGNGSPVGNVTSTYAFETYYDQQFNICYYSRTAGSKNDWLTLDTYCPMTKECYASDSNTCLLDSSAGTTNPEGLGENEVYATIDTSTQEKHCYRIDNSVAVEYFPTEVTVAWKSFSTSTSSGFPAVVTNYKVYRKKLNEVYDLSKPVDTIPATQLSYTDKTAYGGRAYHYKVVPVVTYQGRSFSVFPTENYSEVRMTAPPANYSFVHRWMVNQEVCNKMGYTVDMAAPNRVDPLNNYRCPYNGPGSTGAYYDIGSDYLVDTVEAGCPFTEDAVCNVNGSMSACVGIAAPTSPVPSDGSIYYERGAGKCYYAEASTWIEFNSLPASGVSAADKNTISSLSNSSFNPPAVDITKDNANAFCAMRDPVTILTYPSTPDPTTTAFSIPSRKEQIAFSAPPVEKQGSNAQYLEFADSSIQTIENGESLNANKYCNSNFASGLELNFVDTDYPASSLLFSLPGNKSSSIRSVVTGSEQWGNLAGTTLCKSRYGLQDIYGNVAEWVSDEFVGTSTNVVNSSATDFMFDSDNNGTIDMNYSMNYLIGPCNDSNSDGFCNGADTVGTTEWDISERLFGATMLAFPVGLPFSEIFEQSSGYPNSPIIPYLLDIGRSSGGISSSALHSDKFIINAPSLSGNVSIATGGSFTSGNTSGRFSLKLQNETTRNYETGFRCRAKINYTP